MAKPNPIQRTRTVSTKVTEEDLAGLEAQAAEHDVNLSEWVREALLDRLKPRDALNNETVLAELMALRTIVINLAIAQARRQPMNQDKIQELIAYANRERFRRAEERIGEAAEPDMQPKGKS